MKNRFLKMFQRNTENKLSEKTFYSRILMSAFSMLICTVAMLSSAYAWFTVDISSSQNMIQSANYSLRIEPLGKMRAVDVFTDSNGTYKYDCELTAMDEYEFLLTADGTAENGYCEIVVTSEDTDGNIETETYYTGRIPSGEDREVVVIAARGSTIEFIPTWGSHEDVSTFSLRGNDAFRIHHSRTLYVEYEIVEGVTLEDLADYYGVPVEDICIYNNIEELVVGDVILIPGIEDDSVEPYRPEKPSKATPTNAVKANKATPTNAKKIKDKVPKKEVATKEVIEKVTPSNAALKAADKKIKAESSKKILKIASGADASVKQ